jgi:sulfite reductase (NADPH) flavoprotein alpha-component
MTFRGLLLWIHLILGLTGAIFIAIASVTGAWIVVQVPLERMIIPVPSVESSSDAVDLPGIVSATETRYAPRKVTFVQLAQGKAAVLWLSDRSRAFVNPADGSLLRFRQMRTISFENLSAFMRRMHVSLMLGDRIGRLLVTLATAEALLLALTGLWLWWRRKHWKFTSWRGSIYRVSWDLHNATGLWFLVPALSMIITGLLIYFPGVMVTLAGEELTPFRGAPRAPAVADSQPPVPLSRLLAVADSALPDERIVLLSLAQGRAATVGVEKPTGTVYLNRFSGEVMEVRPGPVPNRADRAYEAVEHLHTGEIFGAPGMTIMALGSVMLAIMTVTGVVLGWKRILILSRKRAEDS